MNFIKKFLCASLVCALLSPNAVFAANNEIDTRLVLSAENDITLFNNENPSEDYDLSGCVDYIIEQFSAEVPPDTIDISSFEIPASNETYTAILEEIYNSIAYDHPEIFYVIPNADTFFLQLKYNSKIFTDILMDYTDEDDVRHYRYYIYSNDEIKERRGIIKQEAEHILSYINDDMSPIEKILTVHDYIVSNYQYDQRTYDEEEVKNANRRLDTMIIEKTGVCQGYTYLFGYMMDMLGIKWASVPSDAHDHIWNKVLLDGKWYNIDVTHDDTDYNIPAGHTRYNHFLLTDSEMKNLSCGFHTAWNDETVNTADSDTYSNLVIHGVERRLVYCGNLWYYFDKNNNLCSIDLKNPSSEPVKVYEDSSQYNTWSYLGFYSSLDVYNNELYFNSSDSLYKYNINKNEAKLLKKYEFDIVEDTKPCIYGLYIKDAVVYLQKAADLNNGISEIIELPINEIKDPDVKPDPKPEVFEYSAHISLEDAAAEISVTPNSNRAPQDTDTVYIAEYIDGVLSEVTLVSLQDFSSEEYIQHQKRQNNRT